MNITEASRAINEAFEAGRIDHDTACRAQDAIRARQFYGQRLTARDRASILRNRFGIEVVS